MAAPPTRKRQLGMSMERSLPKYQFWVIFSVLSTRQFWLGYTCALTRAQHQVRILLLYNKEVAHAACPSDANDSATTCQKWLSVFRYTCCEAALCAASLGCVPGAAPWPAR